MITLGHILALKVSIAPSSRSIHLFTVRTLLPTFMGVTLFVITNAVCAEESGWKQRKLEDGITVYSKAVENSEIDAIRADAEFPVPMEIVIDLLGEIQLRPKWNSICKEARLLSTTQDNKSIVYFYYDLPWPVKDRDMVMEMTTTDQPADARISGKVFPDLYGHDSGAVRVQNVWENWSLEVSGNNTRVTMTAFMDPAGPIPAWLINSMSVSQPFEAMSRLRKMAIERYQNNH